MSSLNFQELRDDCRKLIREFEQNLLLVPPSLRDAARGFAHNYCFNLAYDDLKSCLNWTFKIHTSIYSKYDVSKHFDWEYWIGELSYYFVFAYNGEDRNGLKILKIEFFPSHLQVIYEYPVFGNRCKEVEHLTDIFPHASVSFLVDMGENFFKMVIRDFAELNLKLYKLMNEADPNIFYCWDEARKRANGLLNLSGYKEAVGEVQRVLPGVIKKLVESKSFARSKTLATARKELEELQKQITTTLIRQDQKFSIEAYVV